MSEAAVLAVMYHYVRDRAGTPYSSIRGLGELAFIRQLDFLCQELEPIDWRRFSAWKSGRGRIPERCFLLTFDDGVADHAEVVAPILDQRGLSGVFFVSGSALVGGRVDAAHQIHRLQAILGDDEFDRAVEAWLARNDPSTRWFDEIDMAIARSVYHYETSSRAATKYLLSFSLPIPLRNEMLDALLRQYLGDPRQLATEWYLRPEDLRRMQSDGHTIGGHGFSHEPLERLSAAERRRDIRQSHDMLRLVLGEAERPFSFPYGSFDEQIVDECQAEGFAAAFTTQVGWIGQRDDEGCLNRVDTIKVEEFVGEEIACPRLC